jgi:TPR repeat protein
MAKLAAVFALALLTGCLGGETPLMANKGLEVPAEKIEAFELEALSGSGSVALKLSNHYDAVALDSAKGLYWATVSAENDYSGGMYALGFKLAQKRDEKSRIRARYWLEKAARNGESLAEGILRELDAR